MKHALRLGLVLPAVAGVGALLWWVQQPKGAGDDTQAEAQTLAQVQFMAPSGAAAVSIEQGFALVRAKPKDAAAWRELGNAQLKALKFRDAEGSYNKALAIDPRRAETWSALGEARIQFQNADGANMPPGAAEAFRKALALDPQDPRSRFYFAMEKDFAGQHDAAIGEWLNLLREVPAGSDADNSIRAAITASVARNQKLIARAIQRASEAQPRKIGE